MYYNWAIKKICFWKRFKFRISSIHKFVTKICLFNFRHTFASLHASQTKFTAGTWFISDMCLGEHRGPKIQNHCPRCNHECCASTCSKPNHILGQPEGPLEGPAGGPLGPEGGWETPLALWVKGVISCSKNSIRSNKRCFYRQVIRL